MGRTRSHDHAERHSGRRGSDRSAQRRDEGRRSIRNRCRKSRKNYPKTLQRRGYRAAHRSKMVGLANREDYRTCGNDYVWHSKRDRAVSIKLNYAHKRATRLIESLIDRCPPTKSSIVFPSKRTGHRRIPALTVALLSAHLYHSIHDEIQHPHYSSARYCHR